MRRSGSPCWRSRRLLLCWWNGLNAQLAGGPAPARLATSSLDQEERPPATRSPSSTWTALTVASHGETSGVSIFIASRTRSGWRCATWSPFAPAPGSRCPASARRSSSRRATRCRPRGVASSTSGGEWGGGAGRLSRQAPSHGPVGIRTGGLAAGSRSERGRRPAGVYGRVRDEPTEERRFVVTPATSVSSASASRASAFCRVGPWAISFAIIGRSRRRSRRLLRRRHHADPGRKAQPLEPPSLWEKRRGSSAYSRTSTA